MKRQEDKYPIGSGTYPNWLAINTSGPGLTDGSPYLADNINDGWEGVSQAIMHYAFNSGLTQKTNIPTGSVGDPNGFLEVVGQSQILQALQKAHGIGPGRYVLWGGGDYVAPNGDRVLLLAAQTVLITDYPALDAACYVGDANNTTVFNNGGYFYRSSDPAGTIPNIAGPYLKLPPQPRPTFLREYTLTVTGVSWTTDNAKGIPYLTINNVPRLRFNIRGLVPSTPRTSYTATISAISTQTGTRQAVAGFADGANSIQAATQAGGGGLIDWNHPSATTGYYAASGDIALNSMPTWATNFYYKWGIVY